MTDFESDCECNININKSGAIVYQSTLKLMYSAANWGHLFSIIEDHITNEESIDWPSVWKEWKVNQSQ